MTDVGRDIYDVMRWHFHYTISGGGCSPVRNRENVFIDVLYAVKQIMNTYFLGMRGLVLLVLYSMA